MNIYEITIVISFVLPGGFLARHSGTSERCRGFRPFCDRWWSAMRPSPTVLVEVCWSFFLPRRKTCDMDIVHMMRDVIFDKRLHRTLQDCNWWDSISYLLLVQIWNWYIFQFDSVLLPYLRQRTAYSTPLAHGLALREGNFAAASARSWRKSGEAPL